MAANTQRSGQQGWKIRTSRSGIVLSSPAESSMNSPKPQDHAASRNRQPRPTTYSRPGTPRPRTPPRDRPERPPGLAPPAVNRRTRQQLMSRLNGWGPARGPASPGPEEGLLKKLQTLQLGKEMVEEQNRQMALQTAALLEERAKAQPEIGALDSRHATALAKVELLESLRCSPAAEHKSEDEDDDMDWAAVPV